MDNNQYQIQFGSNVLGPIIERFCFKLWLSESYYEENNTAILFLARGGLRLRLYYELFLDKYKLTSHALRGDFLVSRIAVHKAALLCDAPVSAELISKEFEWTPVVEAFEAIFGKSTVTKWADCVHKDLAARFAQERMTPQHLLGVLSGEYDADGILNAHLKEHYTLFQKHAEQQIHGRENLLLVDTGWSGSIVKSIKTLLPAKNILGCYYGKHSYGKVIDEAWYNDIVGLEAEGVRYKWNVPGTSIFLHRHLLEGLCEVDWPSVVAYKEAESGEVVSSHGAFSDELRLPHHNDSLGRGVVKFLEQDSAYRPYACLDVANKAVAKLNRTVVFPNRRDTLLTVSHRSADFGKDIDVPVLLTPAGRFKFKDKVSNIKTSLWTGAQITLEFPVLYPLVQFAYYLKMIKGNL